jgi:hypothetical protein
VNGRNNNNEEVNNKSTNLDVIENNKFLSEVEMENDEETENQNELLEILGANSNVSTNTLDGIVDDISNVTNLKPGSLIVLRKNSTDEQGKTNLQIYVVSTDYDNNNPNCKDNLLPIDLTPDILETVTDCIKDIEPKNIPQECNIP